MQTYKSLVNTTIQAPTTQYKTRQFYLQKMLGQGSEGGVYLAEQRNGDPKIKQVALKIQNHINDQERMFIDTLIQYQNKYENKESQYFPSFIIKIYEIFDWNENVVIAMEIGKENLYQSIKNTKFSNLIEKAGVCIEIAKSIQMLHFIGYAHRDIKPENFILVGNDWKLCDFGLTKCHKDELLKTKYIGTIYYTAPEVLCENEASYSEKIDIWSLGCVFYELLSGKELFPGIYDYYQGYNIEEIRELILTSNKVRKLGDKQITYIQDKLNELKIADVWRKTLFNMLQFEPTKRIPVQEIINTLVPIRIVEMSEKFYPSKEIRKEIPVGAKVFLNQGQPSVFFNTQNFKKPAFQNSQGQQNQVLLKSSDKEKVEKQQESSGNQNTSTVILSKNFTPINNHNKQSPPKQDPKINQQTVENQNNAESSEQKPKSQMNTQSINSDPQQNITPGTIEQVQPLQDTPKEVNQTNSDQKQPQNQDPVVTTLGHSQSDEQQQQQKQYCNSSNSISNVNNQGTDTPINQQKIPQGGSDQIKISELEQKIQRLEGIVNKLVLQQNEVVPHQENSDKQTQQQETQKDISNEISLLKESTDQLNQLIQSFLASSKNINDIEQIDESQKKCLEILHANLSCFLKNC